MSGKSHRKDKNFKVKAAPQQPAAAIPPAVSVTSVETPAVRPAAAAPASATVRAARPAPVSPSVYISRELLTISLLACGMLTVVIIVSIILR